MLTGYDRRKSMTVQQKSAPASTPAVEAGQIYFDGELMPAAEAKVSVLTHALHYGTSVFEGVRAYATDRGAAVFRLREHSQRLLESAKIIGMPVKYSVEQLDQAVIDTVNANELDSAYIRPLLWYGANSLGVNPGSKIGRASCRKECRARWST